MFANLALDSEKVAEVVDLVVRDSLDQYSVESVLDFDIDDPVKLEESFVYVDLVAQLRDVAR